MCYMICMHADMLIHRYRHINQFHSIDKYMK